MLKIKFSEKLRDTNHYLRAFFLKQCIKTLQNQYFIIYPNQKDFSNQPENLGGIFGLVGAGDGGCLMGAGAGALSGCSVVPITGRGPL